jgi:hypothetical protein
MLKVCNYFRLEYNGSEVATKFSSAFEADAYRTTFYPHVPKEQFAIIPYDSGIKIEVDPIRNDEVNRQLSRLKPYNGKGLKYNTLEPLSKYVPHRWEGREVHMAKSAMYNKGTTTLPKAKRERAFVNETSHFESKVERLRTASLSSPHYVDPDKRILSLVQTLSPCEVYRTLKGTVSLSNSELKRRIYQLTHKPHGL